MSGDGKRGDGHRPPATAPIFDSTIADDVLTSGRRFAVRAAPHLSSATAYGALPPPAAQAEAFLERPIFGIKRPFSNVWGIRRPRGGHVSIQRRRRDAEAVCNLSHADVGIGARLPLVPASLKARLPPAAVILCVAVHRLSWVNDGGRARWRERQPCPRKPTNHFFNQSSLECHFRTSARPRSAAQRSPAQARGCRLRFGAVAHRL